MSGPVQTSPVLPVLVLSGLAMALVTLLRRMGAKKRLSAAGARAPTAWPGAGR